MNEVKKLTPKGSKNSSKISEHNKITLSNHSRKHQQMGAADELSSQMSEFDANGYAINNGSRVINRKHRIPSNKLS